MAGKKKKKKGRPAGAAPAPDAPPRTEASADSAATDDAAERPEASEGTAAPEAEASAPAAPETEASAPAAPETEALAPAAPEASGDLAADRRRFLQIVGVGAVGAGALGIWLARRRARVATPDEPDGGAPETPRALEPVPRPANLVTFNEHQYDTLDALAGVLLPADDQDPGARETGAMIYIDRAMATPAFAVGARTMKVAVNAIDWQSQQAYAKKFVELSFAEQQAVVDAVYQGEADKNRFKGRTFMTLMMSMVLEGHLSEPYYGGNKDELGWKLVAFEPLDPRPGHPDSGGHGGHG